MTSRLHTVEIQNFKAFRSFSLDLEGRHLLVYGANGSGKSSLYWALFTFLQSANKPTPEVAKYFDPDGAETLLNLHEQKEETPRPGQIALTFRDTTATETRYRISAQEHSTHQQPAIKKGDLASDFVTYRYFFRFSNVRNSERFDIWPLFEKEILPFCVTTAGARLLPDWNRIASGNPNPFNKRGVGGTRAYESFEQNCQTFNGRLSEVVRSIQDRAQALYDEYFAAGDAQPITLRLVVTGPARYDPATKTFFPPIIEFGVVAGTTQVSRPQVYFNEAKLTQMALSIRFAASFVNLHQSAIKLLVLDDLLISLDMSNRMRVLDILLSETFEVYQKVILTHDYGFFQECERRIGFRHADWTFLSLGGTPATAITCQTRKDPIQRAEDYLAGHQLDEAAHTLRKAAEDTVERYLHRDEHVDPTSDFASLAENLKAARNRLRQHIPLDLYEQVLRNTPPEHRTALIPQDDADLDNDTTLDEDTRRRLKTQRKKLRRLVTHRHMDDYEAIQVVDGVLESLKRVLNPASHTGTAPLYEKEVQDALDLIRQLDRVLDPPDAS